MKLNLKLLFGVSLLLIPAACEDSGWNGSTSEPDSIQISSVAFTECNNSDNKSANCETATLIFKKEGNYLHVKAENTEFCCGADSITINDSINNNAILIEIVDNGPHTHCFCPREIEFLIGPLSNEDYCLTYIESEHSYDRDTLNFCFDFSEDIDTTITNSKSTTLGDNPLTLSNTVPGGCNNSETEMKDAIQEFDSDTVIITKEGNDLNIYVGYNAGCCITYSTESYIEGDTLKININELENMQCDCICYYTFDFTYSDYSSQAFYYKIYIEPGIILEGKYNISD